MFVPHFSVAAGVFPCFLGILFEADPPLRQPIDRYPVIGGR